MLLKEMMQSFDLQDVDLSLSSLLLAAEEVENVNFEHPIGFHSSGNNRNASADRSVREH